MRTTKDHYDSRGCTYLDPTSRRSSDPVSPIFPTPPPFTSSLASVPCVTPCRRRFHLRATSFHLRRIFFLPNMMYCRFLSLVQTLVIANTTSAATGPLMSMWKFSTSRSKLRKSRIKMLIVGIERFWIWELKVQICEVGSLNPWVNKSVHYKIKNPDPILV